MDLGALVFAGYAFIAAICLFGQVWQDRWDGVDTHPAGVVVVSICWPAVIGTMLIVAGFSLLAVLAQEGGDCG